MTIFEVLMKSGGTDRIRRKKNPQSVFVIIDGEFFWDNSSDDKTAYPLNVADLLAKDWEVERKEWKSK